MLFFTLILLSVGQCWAILGGKRVNRNYPFFVAIGVQKGDSTTFCGGTLIAPNAVLTSAHCFLDFDLRVWVDTKDISVAKGNFAITNEEEMLDTYACARYFCHPNFTGQSLYDPFNIAIIRLKKCIDLSKPENGLLTPCSLFREDFPQALVLGMGAVRKNPEVFPASLRGIMLERYFPCAQIFETANLEFNEDVQVCYGSFTKFPAATTEGDTGSPLVSITSSGEARCLIGVSAFGDHDPIYVNVFTRADSLVSWLELKILNFAASCSLM